MRSGRESGGLCHEHLILAVIQVMVFALLILALTRSSNEMTKRGIYQDLETTFEFKALQALSSRANFRGTMVNIADNSKVRPCNFAAQFFTTIDF